MTGNQISYVRYLEDVRHNLASERISQSQIDELKRHNIVAESQSWANLLETERSNKAREAYNYAALSESSRHNRAQESLGWYQAQQLAAHYQRADSIAAMNAQTSWYNVYHSLQQGEERLRIADESNRIQELGTWLRFGVDVGKTALQAVPVIGALSGIFPIV